MYCLDSSIMVPLIRGDKDLKKRVDSIKSEDISFTTISLCELFKGAYKSSKKDESIRFLYEILRNYKVLSLNIKSSESFGADYNELEKRGAPTQILDLMIASIAKSNNLIIVTRDRNHFKNIPDLKVEEW